MWWLIPAIAAAVALVLGVIGIVAVLRANRSLQRGLERVQIPRPWMDPAQPAAALERLQTAGDGIAAAVGRSAAALQQIRAGLIALRLPEAVSALRLAAVAVRLLVHAR